MKGLKLASISLVLVILLLNNISAKSQILSPNQYVDPKGFFKIFPPKNWKIQEYPSDPRGKIAILGPDGVQLRILVNSVDFNSFQDLMNWCQNMKVTMESYGMKNILIKKVTFIGIPAVQRTFQWRNQKFLYIDFLIENADHNLAYSAPVEVYDKYFPIVMQSIKSYEPIHKTLSEKESIEFTISKYRRLAELMLINGYYELALKYVEEGLKLAPKDLRLLNLKKLIINRQK